MPQPIRFNVPFITGHEQRYIAEAIAKGEISADGAFTKRCSQLLEQHLGIGTVLLTPSCTAALEMAAILANLGPGDEVILPSFTFVATANAVARLGAKPVFVDIRPDTLNLDERLVEEAITPRTRAIAPVHYGGVGCEMDRLMELANRHGLTVIEDAAQGVNALYKGRFLGAIGHLGAYSFHHTKNFVCGEGGAICLNSPELVERAVIIRDKGTNRRQFVRGQVDKYTWVDTGSSYVPSELCSAFLWAQLEQLDEITARRREVHHRYQQVLQPLIDVGFLELPRIPSECTPNYHLFAILLADTATRDALARCLQQQGIQAVFHYVPLHTSPMGERFGYRPGNLPVTERLSGRLLRLPLHCHLTEADQQRVADAIGEFYRGAPIESSRRAAPVS